jgi:dihydrofolate reductase
MRKLIVFMITTLDGCVADPEGRIDWHIVDEQFNEFANQQLDSADLLLFGRITYEGMAGYWPTPAAALDDPAVAAKMNAMPKIVFSRTLDQPDWQNTRLVRELVASEITRLKQQPGRNILIFGSSRLAASLINMGLIDEFRIMISPCILGAGQPLFAGANRLSLRLVKTEPFRAGNILHYYVPA